MHKQYTQHRQGTYSAVWKRRQVEQVVQECDDEDGFRSVINKSDGMGKEAVNTVKKPLCANSRVV